MPMPTDLLDAPPVHGLADLLDPERFRTIRGVPVFDVHEDPDAGSGHPDARGDVDLDILKKLARNTNAQVGRGNFPAITIGHTRPRHTKEIERGGVTVRILGTHEADQPKIVGYSTNYQIRPFHGRPCLHADWHIHAEHLDEARSYPFRSIERIPGVERVDRISIQKSPPERDLGVLRYARRDEAGDDDDDRPGASTPIERYCYARDFPPLDGAGTGHPPNPEPEPELESDPESRPVPVPTPLSSLPEVNPMADAMTPAPPDVMGQLLQAIQGLGAKLDGLPDAVIGALTDHAQETVDDHDGDGDPDAVNYEDDPDADDAMTYAAEAGGDDTSLPGCDAHDPDDKDRRMKYERKFLGKLAEQDDAIAYLFGELQTLRAEKRRMNYEKSLGELTSEGYAIDIEAELADLAADAPEGYEDRQLTRMRKNYTRSAANSTARVAVADPAGPPGKKGPKSREDVNRINLHMSRKAGCTYEQALSDLGMV